MAINYHKLGQQGPAGTTGTGLDQLADMVTSEINLTNTLSTPDMQIGLNSVNGILGMVTEAISTLRLGQSGIFSADDVTQINSYIREHHLDEYTALFGGHGFGGWETGWQLVYGEGAAEKYNRRTNTIDHHLDGLMRLGQEFQNDQIIGGIRGFRRQDPYSAQLLADILNVYWQDPSTTYTGLDRLTDVLKFDRHLLSQLSLEDRNAAAAEMDALNTLLLEGMEAYGLPRTEALRGEDARNVFAYVANNAGDKIPSISDIDAADSALLKALDHGAKWTMFGSDMGLVYRDILEAVRNPASDSAERAAEAVTFFLVDPRLTGTPLDEIVQILKSEFGLQAHISAAELNEAAEAAGEMNSLIVEAIKAQELDADGIFSPEDVMAISNYLHSNHYERFLELRGTSGPEGETGLSLIFGEGAGALYQTWLGKCNQVWGRNLVDDVLKGIYEMGFGLRGERFIDPADWLKTQIDASGEFATVTKAGFGAHNIVGTDGADRIVSYSDGGEPDPSQGARVSEEVAASMASDRLTGGAGADSFEFHTLMNAKKAIIDKHTDASGNVDWMAIMKENTNVHDHWVEGIGNDVITDFTKAEGDKIVVRGHTVAIQSIEYGVDEQGEFSLVSLYSNQMKGGAHHNDALGSIKVYGDKVTAEDIQLDGAMMIMDGMDILSTEFVGQADRYGNVGGTSVREVATWLNDFFFDKDTGFGSDGRDRWRADGATEDHWFGMGGNDQLWSRSGDDYVDGGDGHDEIRAGHGDDYVFGGAGNDKISGEHGNDMMIGGTGGDRVSGGWGDDVFIITGDRANDRYWGGKGVDKYMVWAEDYIGTERIHDFYGNGGEEIILGGEVASFSIGRGYGRRFNKTVNLFDKFGESLGRIAVRGNITEDDIRIDPLAFAEYQQDFLTAGVDISAEMEMYTMMQETAGFEVTEDGEWSFQPVDPITAVASTSVPEEAAAPVAFQMILF